MEEFLTSFPVSLFGGKSFYEYLNSDGNNQFDIVTPTADERKYSAMLNESANVWFDRSLSFINLGRKDKEDIEGIANSICKVVAISLGQKIFTVHHQLN